MVKFEWQDESETFSRAWFDEFPGQSATVRVSDGLEPRIAVHLWQGDDELDMWLPVLADGENADLPTAKRRAEICVRHYKRRMERLAGLADLHAREIVKLIQPDGLN